MDIIVVFANQNDILWTKLFDEARKVNPIGVLPVGNLGKDEGIKKSFLIQLSFLDPRSEFIVSKAPPG
jgi:hypothetical protein